MKGTLYWITGLSGAGKTTIGSSLYRKLRIEKSNVVFLDGDVLREVFGSIHGHSVEERKALALSYSNLCKMLTDQGIDVVCATMSLFSEVHEFNRSYVDNYFEIFVDCDMGELVRRDQKGIYSRAKRGEISNVIGVDLPFDRPQHCDLVIDNTTQNALEEKTSMILHLSAGKGKP